MARSKQVVMSLALLLGMAAVGWTQRMGRGMGQAPQIPGVFKPVVGSGAEYQITQNNQTAHWAYAVVGEEMVEGNQGYWLEMRMEGGEAGGMIMKSLAVVKEGTPEVKRMIMQQPGQTPIEFPVGFGMMGAMKRGQSTQGSSGLGEKVGTETVTVPAGTFVCDHYRTKSGDSVTDAWFSTKVSPYGMVKMTSAEWTIVLEKVLTNETSRIQGQPRKMEMPHF